MTLIAVVFVAVVVVVFNGVEGDAVGPGSARGSAFIPHSEPASFGDMPP